MKFGGSLGTIQRRRRGVGGGEGTPPSAMVAPPTISGEAIEGGTLWVDDGLDDPTTTYTRQWVSGASDPPSTPISGQTGQSLTVPSIGGQYVACLVTPANGEAARLSDVVRVHYATMTAPVLLRTSTSGGSPFTYTITYDNTVFADDIERVQYASDPDFGPATILWDATRGLTEAAFSSPFTPDETADADPAWSSAPPTFTGTYFVRRRVQSLDGLVTSFWSNIESNVTLDLAVRLSPTSGYIPYGFEPTQKFTYSNGNLSFVANPNDKMRGALVNYFRTGRRTAEMRLDVAPTGDQLVGFGFTDGLTDWTQDIQWNVAGMKGIFAVAQEGNTYLVRNNGGGSTGTFSAIGGGWLLNDIMRLDYTPGTFTADVADNNGTLAIYRIRAGVKTLVGTETGIASFVSSKVTVTGALSGAGTMKFTGLTPAIETGSQEYQ